MQFLSDLIFVLTTSLFLNFIPCNFTPSYSSSLVIPPTYLSTSTLFFGFLHFFRPFSPSPSDSILCTAPSSFTPSFSYLPLSSRFLPPLGPPLSPLPAPSSCSPSPSPIANHILPLLRGANASPTSPSPPSLPLLPPHHEASRW